MIGDCADRAALEDRPADGTSSPRRSRSPFVPQAVAVGEGARLGHRLRRRPRRRGSIRERIASRRDPGRPRRGAASPSGAGAVWVANAVRRHGLADRSADDRVVGDIQVGGQPARQSRSAGGDVWVAGSARGHMARPLVAAALALSLARRSAAELRSRPSGSASSPTARGRSRAMLTRRSSPAPSCRCSSAAGDAARQPTAAGDRRASRSPGVRSSSSRLRRRDRRAGAAPRSRRLVETSTVHAVVGRASLPGRGGRSAEYARRSPTTTFLSTGRRPRRRSPDPRAEHLSLHDRQRAVDAGARRVRVPARSAGARRRSSAERHLRLGAGRRLHRRVLRARRHVVTRRRQRPPGSAGAAE